VLERCVEKSCVEFSRTELDQKNIIQIPTKMIVSDTTIANVLLSRKLLGSSTGQLLR
jgi:hypothetical protein